MDKRTVPKFFLQLLSEGCIQKIDILQTQDGFWMICKSLSDILSEKDIFDFSNSDGERLLCSRFYDDWFLYADTIVKLYYAGDSVEDIKRAQEYARKAFVMGIPTAIPFDIVKCDDMYSLVFELVNEDIVSNCLNEHPEPMEDLAKICTDSEAAAQYSCCG